MRGTLTLPDGYAGLCSIDLQKDKRLALLINGLALLIALPLVFLGNRIVPLRTLFSMDDGFGFYFLRLGMLTAGYAAYVVLHELVHGVCMKYFSGAPCATASPGCTRMRAAKLILQRSAILSSRSRRWPFGAWCCWRCACLCPRRGFGRSI